MPLLKIQANVAVPAERHRELLAKASALAAELLGKPERYVMVTVEDARAMLFAGTDAPLAYLELKSIGLPAERTAAMSQRLCELLHSELGIPQERVYIEFADAARPLWGWNGGTF
jgi:phenylpyruvate tautomerase PptA (4-oxalocrotonate tautomerase family)